MFCLFLGTYEIFLLIHTTYFQPVCKWQLQQKGQLRSAPKAVTMPAYICAATPELLLNTRDQNWTEKYSWETKAEPASRIPEQTVHCMSLAWVRHNMNIKFRLLISYNTPTSLLSFHCFWSAQPLKKTSENLEPATASGFFIFRWGFGVFSPQELTFCQ